MAAVRHLRLSKTWLPPSWIEHCSLGLAIFNHYTKFGAKMLIDAEIMAKNRKSKMAAVRHLGFSKTWFLSNWSNWAGDFPFRYQIWCKMLIDAKIMAQNRDLRWRPSAILDFLKPLFWARGPLGIPIFHLGTKFGKSKSKMAAVRHLGFVTSSYRTIHEVFSLAGQILC